jgi:thiamine-phosphate pyrophosphorylase
MAERCLLCYITDRHAFSGDELSRRRQLLDKIAETASAGIDYIQLRENDLSARNLETLAREAMQIVAREKPVALLINSRIDVALAANANGVHLRANDISPREVRTAWQESYGQRRSRGPEGLSRELSAQNPLISVSCHSPKEVHEAATNAATFAVFAPIFEKKDSPETVPAGLEALRQACHAPIPVLALGGITIGNAKSCLKAGASGIAAIRLFQENDIATVVRALRP